ncbi:Respiratory supercomplex factor 2 [Neolecta irregularis DAH-3]|uniref:Respiratory supercomplex factor 2 n=1 Tax=Neolecta irregularis (strain DAH-3) TaxID=1198029 RepID=A0A1U7LQ87_NEOID|nr:Respiratory supercomplex factor 2 [Neolecta irregularis DAH-3]|eukprot:OLL24836.1 Respiratory supercomplex factor 2 [Neolecta irregularis DAH-3]
MDTFKKPVSTKQWFANHRYHIILGSWALGMGGSFALVARNKYLTTGQKLVQARMYAQAITLAVLLGTAGLSQVGEDGNEVEPSEKKRAIWEEELAEGERELKNHHINSK